MDTKRKKNIKKLREKILPVLKKYNVERAGIFGSAARGDESSGSDIDIVVKLPEDNKLSLLDFAGIKVELEEATGRNVDIVQYKLVKPALKDIIREEEVIIL
jgi:hypothetical protein